MKAHSIKNGRVLTLSSEGPDMAGRGKMTKFKDVVESKSDDHRVLTSQMFGEEGRWHKLMSADYRGKK